MKHELSYSNVFLAGRRAVAKQALARHQTTSGQDMNQDYALARCVCTFRGKRLLEGSPKIELDLLSISEWEENVEDYQGL